MAVVKAGSPELLRVSMANDSDSSVYEYVDGEFINLVERQQREAVAAVAAERKRQVYTDPQTGLMWAKNGSIAGKKMKWDDAMSWAKNLHYGGYSDWRVPSKKELELFSRRGGNKPSEWFNTNGFNFVQAYDYLSSTAGVVDMYGGYMDDYNKSFSNFVWPVRGGQ